MSDDLAQRRRVGARLTGFAAFLILLGIELVAFLMDTGDGLWTWVFYGAPVVAFVLSLGMAVSGRGRTWWPILAGTLAATALVAVALGVLFWYLIVVVGVS